MGRLSPVTLNLNAPTVNYEKDYQAIKTYGLDLKDKDNCYIKIMKNNKDINNSLNNIKKALREEKDVIADDKKIMIFFY